MGFDAVCAPVGALGFWATSQENDPAGMWALLEPMAKLPLGDVLFTTTFVPGLALLVVIGVPHALALALLLRRRPLAHLACLAAGVCLVAWIGLQLFVLYGPNPMSLIWGLIGLAETTLAVVAIKAQPARPIAGSLEQARQ
jgi:hypothetical protein